MSKWSLCYWFSKLCKKKDVSETHHHHNDDGSYIAVARIDANGEETWDDIPLTTEIKIDTDGHIYFKIRNKWELQPDIVGVEY